LRLSTRKQDGRMMKLRQKLSGGFRSVVAARDFAVIRSPIPTARQQGWDLLQTLPRDSNHLVANSDSPEAAGDIRAVALFPWLAWGYATLLCAETFVEKAAGPIENAAAGPYAALGCSGSP
jgi:hypothetical protein